MKEPLLRPHFLRRRVCYRSPTHLEKQLSVLRPTRVRVAQRPPVKTHSGNIRRALSRSEVRKTLDMLLDDDFHSCRIFIRFQTMLLHILTSCGAMLHQQAAAVSHVL